MDGKRVNQDCATKERRWYASRMRKLRSIFVIGPIPLCLFLVACNVSPLSYPHFWDHPKAKLTDTELVGTYKILKLRLSGDLSRAVRETESVITLNADHTATLTNFPEFDGFGDTLLCKFSGSVHWQVDNVEDWWISFESHHPERKMVVPECRYENSVWPVSILSRHAPYRLYSTVGDPDSDEGVEFEKVGP
jgi:hypothetical protein